MTTTGVHLSTSTCSLQRLHLHGRAESLAEPHRGQPALVTAVERR